MKQDYISKMDSLLSEDRLPFSTSTEDAKRRVMRRVEKADNVIPLKSSNRILTKLAIAASIAVFLGLSYSFFGSETVVNSSDSVMAHTLPDGSIIYMNHGSELIYNDLTWIFSRDLDFSGSGFFEVEKGSKFSVSTNVGVVSVLGTSFSVNTNYDLLKVACKTGKVLVENENALSVILEPGNRVEMNKTSAEERTLEPRYIDAWVSGTYRFDNVSINQVLSSLEDFTEYQVEFPESLDTSYSGEFSTNQSIEEILEIVCKPMSLTYELVEEKSLIRILNK